MPDRSLKAAEKVLAAIRRAKLFYPDQRVGQIVINALDAGVDLFYVEDDLLEVWLNNYARKGSPKSRKPPNP